MQWLWWLLPIALVLAYLLGMIGSKAFTRPRGPDRRVGERRVRERRQPGGDFQGVQRRVDDRRKGDRRRPRPVWPGVTVIASAMVLTGVAVVSYAVTPVPSFFADQQTQLLGSGWANCSTPITWSVDTSRLTPADAKIAMQQMTADFAKWSQASGLQFSFVGEIPITYNDATYRVTGASHPSDRHIFVGFLNNTDAPSLLNSRTVGFASPSQVTASTKEIVEGAIVLSIDYVKKVNAARESALYLHELGHALGLGHGATKSDVMYYIVGTNAELSPSDIAGIRQLTKICPQ